MNPNTGFPYDVIYCGRPVTRIGTHRGYCVKAHLTHTALCGLADGG